MGNADVLPKQMGFTIYASAACRLVPYAIPNLDPNRLRWATVITFTVTASCLCVLTHQGSCQHLNKGSLS